MHMGRLVLGSLAFLFSAGAFAYPVTYAFTGTVTGKDPLFSAYNDNPAMVGMITLDVEDVRADVPYSPFWFEYQVSMAGQSFYGSWTYISYTGFSDGIFSIFDEIPHFSFTGPADPPDMGELIFNFSGNPFGDHIPTSDWPVSQFIGGRLRFFGGAPSEENRANSSIVASIDSLSRVTPVPEPASAALLSIGLLGLLVRRRKNH